MQQHFFSCANNKEEVVTSAPKSPSTHISCPSTMQVPVIATAEGPGLLRSIAGCLSRSTTSELAWNGRDTVMKEGVQSALATLTEMVPQSKYEKFFCNADSINTTMLMAVSKSAETSESIAFECCTAFRRLVGFPNAILYSNIDG